MTSTHSRISRAARCVSVVIVLTLACSHIPPTPEEGQASVSLVANPTRIPVVTGISEITAIGTRSIGTSIWERTQVSFVADSGRVDPPVAEFHDGRAVTRFFAGPSSGQATITAVCGSIKIEPLTIDLGGGTTSLVLSANRASLPPKGGRVALRVIAYDDHSNLVVKAPIIFTATHGVLASGGRQVLTGSDGVAKDTLTTDADSSITVYSGDVVSNSLDIVVATSQNEPPTADFVYSPTQPVRNSTVHFNGDLSEDTDGRIVRWSWDFGDGRSAEGRHVTSTYTEAGTYAVVLCVTDNGGARRCTSKSVEVEWK